MNRRLLSGLALASLAAALSCRGATNSAPAETGPVYVVPVQGMIERGLVYVMRRGVAEAIRQNASLVVLDMDTPGGRLDATEKIMALISRIPCPVVTYVNPNAISAGAIIALSTDRIYMAPAGRIGDAMPIMMSPLPMGGAQEIPEGIREKAISPTVALIRSAAQRKGHDPDLAEAMVRPEFEYRIGDEVICPAGQLLTLTSQDAARLVGEGEARRPLLSSGTADTLDSLLAQLGHAGATPRVLRQGPAETLARVIEGFPVSGLLLAAGLVLLYIEIKTPGFGLPGLGGLALLALWFWGHHIAGLAGMGEVMLFLAGVVLLFIELFVTPGFGVLGVAGIGCILASLFMAQVPHLPGGPWLPRGVEVRGALTNLSLSLLLAFAAGILLARALPETRAFQRLMLATVEDPRAGYQASAPTGALVGLTGTCLTPLRPSGIGLFDGRRLNVIARGEFIEKDRRIRVAEAHGNRIIVEAAGEPQATGSGETPA
jgi:membrane-bound serine protease (ClpP class)